jgi:hypothetical protein
VSCPFLSQRSRLSVGPISLYEVRLPTPANTELLETETTKESKDKGSEHELEQLRSEICMRDLLCTPDSSFRD